MLADGFYAAGLTALVAGLVRLFADPPPSVPESVLTGLALARLWHTRPEDTYLAGCFVTAAGLALALRRRRPRDWIVRSLGPALAIPILCLLAATIALRGLNFARYGVFVGHELFAPGFVAAYGELARIEPDAPRRYVSIPATSRAAAYAVSPTFRTLQSHLEGPLRQSWIVDSCPWLHVCDDYANGWFVFALRDAAAWSGHYVSAAETDAFYGRVAAELAACADGRLRCGTRPWGFLPPRPRSYLPALPGALVKVSRLLLVSFPPYPPGDPETTPDTEPAMVRLRRRLATRSKSARTPTRDLRRPPGDRSTSIVPVASVGDAGPDVRYAVDARDETGPSAGIAAPVRGALVDLHPWLVVILTALAAAAPLLCLGLRLRPRPRADVAAAFLLLTFVVAARLGLLALVEASSFEVGVRYVYPIAGLLTVLLLVVTAEAGGLLWSRLRPPDSRLRGATG